VDQYTDSQYDDDLTIGADEYDESFQTSDIDLFEFGGEEDSPISRLKTLVLSIDWEITDEVLLQFNDELLDLKDVWVADKVRMVYLQALQKIGKYIQRQKADSHPNAIKLLLSMYYNLERIVLSEELSADEKKKILIEDVRRFERLKKQIGKEPQVAGAVTDFSSADESEAPLAVQETKELLDLKAIVLGIDWEITEKDLIELREEVVRLEAKYSDSRPRLVFLQGIGTLGAYIRKKKSNAHADAFKLLHSFYEGLEKIVQTPMMTLEKEKAILLPEVEKFNLFKSLIAKSLTQVELEPTESAEQDEDYGDMGSIAPAFADMPEDDVHGFQEEAEAAALGVESPVSVNAHIDKFFGEDPGAESTPVEEFAPEPELPVAPVEESVDKEAEELSSAFFDGGEEVAPVEVDRETALKGVDVETEADDDSEEEALPFQAGEVAPALVDSDVASAFSVTALGESEPETEISDEITGRLDDFFDKNEPEEAASAFGVDADKALQGVNVESEGDEDEEGDAVEMKEAEDALDFDEIAPAFADIDDDFELPDDLLSGTELPMDPAEFDEQSQPLSPDSEEFDDIPEPLDARAEATALEADLSAFDDVDFKDVAEPEAEAEETVGTELPPELDFGEFEDIPAALSDEEFTEQDELRSESVDAESAVEERFDALFGTPADEEDVTDITEPVGEAEPESVSEDQADQFFSLEEDAEEDDIELEVAADSEDVAGELTEIEEISADELFVVDEPVAALDEADVINEPEAEDVLMVQEEEEQDEEEVVFELAEEEEDAEPEAPAAEDVFEEEPSADVMDTVLTAGAGVVAGIAAKGIAEEIFEEAEEKVPVAESAVEDEFEAVFTAAEEDVVEEPAETVAEITEVAEPIEEIVPEVDLLVDLRGCVQSVGLELNDAIIQGLFAEINSLRQHWVTRPVEKTYLQLLSTVAQHIDQYRYNASNESHELLVKLMDDLEKCQNQDGSKAQEILLSDTCKVLQWQQAMLNGLAVRGEDGYLAFTGKEAVEAEAVLEDESVQEEELAVLEEDASELEIEEPLRDEAEPAEEEISTSVEGAGFSDLVRREIDSLRDTLKREIAELKKALHNDSRKD
jgi:pilus assembly protein FimV